MSPTQVLHEQAALKDFVVSRHYQDYLTRFFDDMQRKGKIGGHPSKIKGVEVPWGKFISDRVEKSLAVAYAYHVQPTMMEVVRSAAADLEGTDYLLHSHLPSEHGFLVFDDAWLSTDVWGYTMTTKAMLWQHGSAALGEFSDGRSRPGIWVWMFTDINDERDGRSMEQKAEGYDLNAIGRLHLNHFFFVAYEERVGPLEVMTPKEYKSFAEGGRVAAEKSPSFNRLVVALFRLLEQTIVEVRDEPLDRTARRTAERKNIPARVQTIQLRRKVVVGPKPEGESHVEWQHQWFVRGTWQWRACGEHHPHAESYEKGWHARVYVRPHWKGPEDAPVLITDKVWSLSR